MNDASPILTEADTCREFVTPALQRAGWGNAPYAIGEQHQITAGRILLIGGKARRAKKRRADYLLYYRRDYPTCRGGSQGNRPTC
jgi:type I restriction enzyme R subunit